MGSIQVESEFPFPIVSFEPFYNGDEAARKHVVAQLYDAFHNYGWVYLKNFGISADEIDQMFARSKQFHDQPLDTKMKYKLTDPSVSQGYTADGAESSDPHGGRSHKECYEHRRVNKLCPAEGELDNWTAWADDFYAKCMKLAEQVRDALALVLGVEPEIFRSSLKQLDGQLRLLNYMPVPRRTLEEGRNFRINPHCDYGLFTLLFQDQIGGLEVDRFHDGNFVPATPIRGTCVINVADLLQRLSNDRLRSTRHRVVAPQLTKKQLDALGPDGQLPARFSTAFFVHPQRDVTVTPLVEEGGTAQYIPVVAGCWRDAVTAVNYKIPLDPKTPEQEQAKKAVELRWQMAANIERKGVSAH